MKTWLDNKSRSHNEFIELLSSETSNRVIEEVKNEEMYSVLADTTSDITHQYRLAICVRYVNNNGNIKERLLGINEYTDKTGFGIGKNVYDTLVRNELNPDFIAFQSFDFASKKLEAKELNIIDASNLIEGTITSLENINKDYDGLDTIVDATLIFSSKIDIDPIADFKKHHHKRSIPKRIDSNPMTQLDFSLKLFYRNEF
ncbi:uncharacterized protein LOC111027719 [Myzus persicae]|uniref:uncharacterized protein LOC111027719 n=1 Tax=Myzus persicae TaxID=13164 RepID=UPI000B93922E|nr:uncharacterized protein LOC111027719 [Myzus persicae]